MTEQVIKAKLFDIYMRGLLSSQDEVQAINNNIVRSDDVNEFNHLQTLLENVQKQNLSQEYPNIVEVSLDSMKYEPSPDETPSLVPRNREENETIEAYDKYLENYYTEKYNNYDASLEPVSPTPDALEISNWEYATPTIKAKVTDNRTSKWLEFACNIMAKNSLSTIKLYNVFSQDTNHAEIPTEVTENKGNRIDQLVTLTSGEKYMIFNQAIYQNRIFYFTIGITADYQNLNGTFTFFEEINQEGRPYLKQVTEKALLNLLLKYLQPIK